LREILLLKISAIKFKDRTKSELVLRRYYSYNIQIDKKQRAIFKVNKAQIFYFIFFIFIYIFKQISNLKAIFKEY